MMYKYILSPARKLKLIKFILYDFRANTPHFRFVEYLNVHNFLMHICVHAACPMYNNNV